MKKEKINKPNKSRTTSETTYEYREGDLTWIAILSIGVSIIIFLNL